MLADISHYFCKDFADIKISSDKEAYDYWWNRHANAKGNPIEYATLLRMEHDRCLASHECLGYTPMSLDEFKAPQGKSECDVIRHKSLNLVAWNQLNQLPAPEWLTAIVPEDYQEKPNKYLLGKMLQTLLAIGLSKLHNS